MNKLIIFSIFIVLKLSLVYTIDWQDGNWAFGCDFTNEENNMGNVQGNQSFKIFDSCNESI